MTADWMPTKGPKTRRLAEARFYQLLFLSNVMESNVVFFEVARKEIPEAWQTLEMDVETEAPKEKVTLYLDRAVITMFRKMGKGYQGRINRVLETWLQMKIAEKGELRKRVMERVRDAREDKNREDVGDKMQAEYETFVEERAYMEGFQDAVRRGERQKGK